MLVGVDRGFAALRCRNSAKLGLPERSARIATVPDEKPNQRFDIDSIAAGDWHAKHDVVLAA